MSLVLDASVTLAWCFEDESTPAIDAIMHRIANDGAIAPTLWRLEVANGLQMALRRKRIDIAYRDAALSRLDVLDIQLDLDTGVHAWSATVNLRRPARFDHLRRLLSRACPTSPAATGHLGCKPGKRRPTMRRSRHPMMCDTACAWWRAPGHPTRTRGQRRRACRQAPRLELPGARGSGRGAVAFG